jgi:LacI family transcriptional regulator
MTTIKDVAKEAGVSFKTVSRVLNKDTAVRDATRAKVLAAIEALDYRPNMMARSLRSQRTHTFGFITDQIAITPYAGKILQGAQDLAWQHNVLLLTVNTNGDQKMKQTAVNTLLHRRVDGIIYATMYHREVHPPDNIRDVPAVLLDCYVADHSLPSVVPDELAGGKEIVAYLINKGHRRIGFICDQADVPAKIGRLQGYKEMLTAHNIPFDPDLVQMGESMQSGGYECTMSVMQQPDAPTALFCYNDRMAMGAYDALRKLEMSIPEDIAVVGFDNQELIAAHLYPPLTTMQLPHYQMGEWAVNHLLTLIEEPESASAVQQKVRCPLIERLSA